MIWVLRVPLIRVGFLMFLSFIAGFAAGIFVSFGLGVI